MRAPFAVLGILTSFALSLSSSIVAAAPATPYTEEFVTTADWSTASASLDPPTLNASGGAGGGSYISRELSTELLPEESTLVLFQARDEFNSSGHGFEGDWNAGGLNRVSLYFRHDAPEALPVFLRLTRPTGGAGVVFETPNTVKASSRWTRVTFDISPTSPYTTVEGAPTLYNLTMSNVGHFTFGYSVPADLAFNPNFYTYGLDRISSYHVPEPASWLLAAVGAVFGLFGRRRGRK